MKVLLIGHVWPEPTSSAAGVREMNLIRAFGEEGWEVIVQSQARENEFSAALNRMGVRTVSLGANDSRFDEFVSDLKPDYAIFDRFITEEQFGWRVREHSPETVRVLDTIDLHFLRRARERAFTEGTALELRSDDAFREIASIYRSDLTLLVSDFELALLTSEFGVPAGALELATLAYEASPTVESDRAGFSMIGNFRHPPNADSVRWLRDELWPAIRSRIPSAEVHVFGSYPSREMMSLDQPKSGFRVLGPVDDSVRTLAKYRVNLAPLRFGAGIKGKIADGWCAGIPVVTTPVGAEGMRLDSRFGGIVADNALGFIDAACKLYEDDALRAALASIGRETIESRFSFTALKATLIPRLLSLRDGLAETRRANFVGSMLWHHTLKSTTYFSRWIELKESLVKSK